MKTCKFCKSQFEDKKHPNKEYCCRDCWKKGIKQERGIPCQYCGKIFIDRHKDNKGSKTCSWLCRIRLNDKKFSCANCGKTYRTTVGDNRKFCSSKCANIYNQQPDPNKKETKPCKQCGELFESWVYRKTVFCSKKCLSKYAGIQRGKQLLKLDSTRSRGMNWKQQAKLARKRDNYTCQVCGRHGWADKFKVQVHHIIPYRLFNGDYEKANNLDNLVSLCPSCHPKVEAGVVKLPPK